ncbi:hypothetical protein LCGC14_0408820 [marine sediment metagenome]|uniref:Uncharacterized protein n=1 Tax=marine sediment metagenome TaxID=412755 RepID=A0A0F9SUJ0_9ZZZZ
MVYKVRDREVKICDATGNRVVMEYIGNEYASKNGHPGWLCLHEEDEDDMAEGSGDEEAVEQFLLDQESR